MAMNVTVKAQRAIVIEGATALDPITVYIEDVSPSVGSITITCFGQAWTAFWGGMSGQTIAQFFASSPVDYLATRLANGKRQSNPERTPN